MATNNDFLKVLAKDVVLQWPRLNQTYKYNTAKKASEACAQGAQGAAWSVSWDMTTDDARKLHAELKAHYEAAMLRNPKLPSFSTIFGMKRMEDGKTVTFSAKRSGTKGDGTPNTAPTVIGGDKAPLADLAIWGGSKGTVRAWAYPAVDPDGKGGISMILDAVQVTAPVYGGSGLDDFDEVATGDVFDQVANAQNKTPAADLGDDEIPF